MNYRAANIYPVRPTTRVDCSKVQAKVESRKANACYMQRDITKSNYAKPSHFRAFRLLPFLNSLCRMYSGISRFSSSS